MPPKKATGAAASTKKTSSTPAHASYKDMIKDAIINLKERNGSSRQAIKKYVRSNNNVVTTSEAQFDSLFNKALRSGVEKGELTQPKGPSGPVKLAKKESKPAEKKAAPKKEAKAKAPKTEKKESKPKAATTKKAPTKKTAVKKAPAAKKTDTKAKANTAKPRAKKAATTTKTEAPAPAVVDVPTVLKKTKSGRVAKQKAPAKTDKKAPAKKAATKKATPKKAAASS